MNFLLHLITIISLELFVTLGYNLVFGKGKILHFGQVAVALVSAYAIFVTLRFTGSYLIALPVGFVITMILSALFAWLSLRLPSDAFGVMSIAIHLALLAVVLNWNMVTRGALGIVGIPRLPFLQNPLHFAVISVVLALLWILFLWSLDRGPFGRRMAALAEQEWHARSLGVDVAHMRFVAFLIAGLGTFITSALLPQYLSILHPNDYAFLWVAFLIMIVVAGNPGSVLGVTLSTVLLMLLKEALRFLPLPVSLVGPLRLMLFGAILFAAVWLRREKLFPPKRAV